MPNGETPSHAWATSSVVYGPIEHPYTEPFARKWSHLMIRNRGHKSSVTGPGCQRLDREIEGAILMEGSLSNEITRPIRR
jgi:hypothetical protein